MQRNSCGRNRCMHCKSAVWSRSSQTKHWKMKEENWECERADITFYGKMGEEWSFGE